MLNKDKQYLLDKNQIWSMPSGFGKSRTGPLSHSRWLKAGNRILRYMSLKKTLQMNWRLSIPHFTLLQTLVVPNQSGYFSEVLKIMLEAVRLTRYRHHLWMVIYSVIDRNLFWIPRKYTCNYGYGLNRAHERTEVTPSYESPEKLQAEIKFYSTKSGLQRDRLCWYDSVEWL